MSCKCLSSPNSIVFCVRKIQGVLNETLNMQSLPIDITPQQIGGKYKIRQDDKEFRSLSRNDMEGGVEGMDHITMDHITISESL